MDLASPQPLESLDAGPEPAFRKHWPGWPIVWMFVAILFTFYAVQLAISIAVVLARFGGMIQVYVLSNHQSQLIQGFKSPEMLARIFDAPGLFIIQLVSTAALVGLTIFFCRRVLQARLPDLGLGSALTWRKVGIGLAAGALLMLLSFALEAVQERLVGPHPQAILKIFTQHHGAFAFVLDMCSVAVLAPFAEELFFRGFLFAGLVQRMQLGMAALVSGFLFGLAHADLYNILPLSVLGFGLAYVYYRTGTLWTNVIAHATINGTQLALIFLFPALAK